MGVVQDQISSLVRMELLYVATFRRLNIKLGYESKILRRKTMNADLSRFKVVYQDKVLNAVALRGLDLGNLKYPLEKCKIKPKFIEILAINEDGNMILLHDESWCFQFLPIVNN